MAQKTSIPKGTRDFSPKEMVRRNYIFNTIKTVFQNYGYLPIETPAMENLSTLTGKYGSEPWKIPQMADLPDVKIEFATKFNGKNAYLPYKRDKKTLGRPWAIPGTPDLEHRLGGLEKEDITGNVSYDSDNHHLMTVLRAQKVANVADDYPPTKVFGDDTGDLLVLTWGSTFGPGRTAVERMQNDSYKVSHVHLRYINPLPNDLGKILNGFNNILLPEINLGQLRMIIRAQYFVDAKGLNVIRGRPIRAGAIVNRAKKLMGI